MANRQARYKVGDVIGGEFLIYESLMGGMGELYICLNKKENYPVVLKTFQKTNPNLYQLFEKEVKTWIALEKHPNIVRCYWMRKIDNIPFMGLEWIVGNDKYGTNLREWLRYGSLDIKTSLKFVINICQGLVYADEKVKGIVHRDLKPDNILVTEGKVAKITDFGLAIIKTNLSDDTGGGAGTYAYMPPEQWHTDIDLDARSDIYAVGCILYEMLTGQIPYRGSRLELFKQHQESPIPQINDISSEINAIIQKCMAKDRDNRYPTTQTLLDVITDVYETLTGEKLPSNKAGEMTTDDYINRGHTYVNLKLNDLALKDFEQAIQLNPNHPIAYMNRGACYMYLGSNEQALNDYNMAIQIDPQYATAYMNRGVYYDAIEQYIIALEDFNMAIQLNPNLAEAYGNRGNTYKDLGLSDESIKDYNTAISLNPNFAEAYVNRGNMYHDLGQNNEAISDFNIAIQLNPNLAEAYGGRGNCFSELQKYRLALSDYNKSIEINPSIAETYYNRGNIYQDLGENHKAISDYDTAINLNPKMPQAYYNRALVYLTLENHKQAIVDFSLAIQFNPNYSEAYCNRGLSYQKLGQYHDAIVNYNSAIRINPTSIEAYGNRGNCYADLNQYEQAIKDFETLTSLAPNDANGWLNTGAIYAEADRFEEALKCFEKAHELGNNQALNAILQAKEQLAFNMFPEALSLESMRQIVAKHPVLSSPKMIDLISYTIQTQVPPQLKPEFETRLAWLIQIAKGE